MKLRIFILLVLIFCPLVNAESNSNSASVQTTVSNSQTVANLTTSQNISYENCSKMFAINKEKLFYLTIAAIGANRFSTDEIQSENGYIIFAVGKDKYLATVAGIDSKNSILKITPCNNKYFFPAGILLNMYKYIEVNQNIQY